MAVDERLLPAGNPVIAAFRSQNFLWNQPRTFGQVRQIADAVMSKPTDPDGGEELDLAADVVRGSQQLR
ncbi:MAG: hypothetical protein LBJ02_04600 [Bifidobacteriaceae bacterium]|nr:hypothetical protein [Bifidobacteriaceae bacterium]